MTKKKTSPPSTWRDRIMNKKRRFIFMGTLAGIALFSLVTIAGPWSPLRGSRIRSAFLSSPPPSPSPGNPSKEYIYAGGRLVATEEPLALAAPTNVLAATFSSTQINISWDVNPTAHHYVVERATELGNFTPLNTNVTTNSYVDNTVASVNAYLYRVRSADAAGNVSTPSNVDLATAITFADDPFPASPTFTPIKAQHVLQLRQAINAVRQLTPSLQDYPWFQSTLTAGQTPIKGDDIEELRTALDEASVILGFTPGGYTDSEITGQPFKKQYIKELRDRVK
jgi:hypothetical protein